MARACSVDECTEPAVPESPLPYCKKHIQEVRKLQEQLRAERERTRPDYKSLWEGE